VRAHRLGLVGHETPEDGDERQGLDRRVEPVACRPGHPMILLPVRSATAARRRVRPPRPMIQAGDVERLA
jgi:hypothetical protein